jgi:hypothetical protein
MKKLKVLILVLALALAGLATSRSAAADDDCCVSAQQEIETFCSRLGTSVRVFQCIPDYQGSLCTYWWDCYPPPQ